MNRKFALAESEPDFKQLVEGVTDVIWSAEVDGTVRYLSPQFKTLFGFEPQDWIGRSPIELIHSDDLPKLQESIKLQNGSKERVSLEFRHLCHDGSYLWVGVNAIPIFDDEGNMVCRQGTTRDISQRKQMEKERSRLVQILQSTSDFVGICRPEEGILWQNRPFRALRPDLDIEGGGCDISKLYPQWAGEIVAEKGLPTATEQGIWSGETALLDTSGNEIPTSQVIIAHKSESGEVEYFSTILRDISQIRATELALRDAQSELQTMAESVPGALWRLLLHPDGSHSLPYVSTNVSDLMGLDREALMKDLKEFWKRVHPDDLEEINWKLKRSAETLEPAHSVYRFSSDENETRWIDAWALPSRLDNGVTLFDGISVDVTYRKVPELAKEVAQAQIRSTAENLPGVISRVVVHPDGSQELSYISPRVREMFELDLKSPREDMEEVWRRIHPDDRAKVEQEIHRSAKTLEPYHVAYRLVLEGKGTRWVETWSLPSRLDNGDIVFDGIMIDVTDMGRSDSLQRDINFRQIFDSAPDAVFLISADGEDEGRIVAANSAADRMHGYDAGNLKGKSISELDAPEAAEEVPDRLRRLANGEFLTFEIDHVHKDGSMFPVEVNAFRIFIDGRPYVLAFDRDITERKKAEAERRELQNQLMKTQKYEAELSLAITQSQLQRVAENIPGLVYQFVLHSDGTQSITYIGARCREFFGVDPEEMLEDADVFRQCIEPEDVNAVREKVAESARTLERLDLEYRVAVPDRGIRWYNEIGQPQLQSNGDIVWDGVLLDVSDRREVELANEVLAKATRTKDLFLANMSHELRTPLSAILGMTEGLKQGLYGQTTERQMKTLSVVEESGLHLLELINEILDLVKIETGKTSLKLSQINVTQLCNSCLDLVSPQARRKQIELSFNAAWNPPTLLADETRLRQILINLLGNAIKFTPEGGEVTLKVELLSDQPYSLGKDTLRLTVSDNGIGIEPSHIESLFEPFKQVDSSLSRKYPGAGLGLALVKQFVTLHSGTVNVESQPGKGSRFIVDLPYLEPESLNGAKPIEIPEGTSDLHSVNKDAPGDMPLVLLAEDNDSIAMAFVPIFEASGFEVLRVVNGVEAVQSTLQHAPELILMDIQMPLMDGLEAIGQIRSHAEFVDTPIIALSGFARPEESTRCIEAGASLFVSKPCNLPELISKMEQLVSRDKSV